MGSLVLSLGKLHGGLGRFLPCEVGTHFSMLRHVGWERRSHGLTSRPLESCHHQCLKAVCGLLGYPAGAAAELLDGSVKLRCCTTLFGKRIPSWSFPRFNRLGSDGPCGWLSHAAMGCLEPALEGTGIGRPPSQTGRRGWRTGAGSLEFVCTRARAWTATLLQHFVRSSSLHVHRQNSVAPHVCFYCMRTSTEHPEHIRHHSRVLS